MKMIKTNEDLKQRWNSAIQWLGDELERVSCNCSVILCNIVHSDVKLYARHPLLRHKRQSEY